MNNTLAEEKQVCRCGRSYSHCKWCGSKNLYPKKMRSFEASAQLAKEVYVFGCRRCMKESLMSSEQECKALAVREFNPEFIVEVKPVKAHTVPWGNLTPGSDDYFVAMNAAASELRDKKGITIIKAFVELKKQGWQLELYELDDNMKEALKNAGLLDSKDASVNAQSGTSNASDSAESPNETQASLDDIIKAMNEEQK